MLTSTMFHARAVVCSEPTMCDAIALRMCVIGHDLFAAAGHDRPRNALAAPVTSRQRRRTAGAAAGADAPPAATASITSFFVMRPPVPLPETCEQVEVVLLSQLPHQR